MSYATLMVHMDLNGDIEAANAARLRVAGDLAEAHGSAVIGVAASDPQPAVYADGYVPADVIEADRAALAAQFVAAQEIFRAALAKRTSTLEWRQAAAYPSAWIAAQARGADLVITSVRPEAVYLAGGSTLDVNELVLRAGRPLLIVPQDAQGFKARRIVVGWKDTREARRAVADALPLLRHAEAVFVATVAETGMSEETPATIADVQRWLTRHGVASQERYIVRDGDAPVHLDTLAWEEQADLFVAGAYGHSRLREWVLGGVTRSLVSSSRRCVLLSH